MGGRWSRLVLFGTITTELLPTLPGHIPHGNHGRPVTPPALTLSELDTVVGRYIVDTYHHRVHPEIGQTPLTRWSAGDWLPRMPDSLEALDLLLLTVAVGSSSSPTRCVATGTSVSATAPPGWAKRCPPAPTPPPMTTTTGSPTGTAVTPSCPPHW